METMTLSLPNTNPRYVGQVLYALRFCSSTILDVVHQDQTITLHHTKTQDTQSLRGKAESILARYSVDSNALQVDALWEHNAEWNPVSDPFDEMLESELVNAEGHGRVALRGILSELAEFLDASFLKHIARPLGCQRENYPGTIAVNDLGQAGVFQSLPQHMRFVAHLHHDLESIDSFSQAMKNHDFSGSENPPLPQSSMATPDAILNPAVCYHCYLTLKNQRIGPAGHSVTARSRCHRFEGNNVSRLSRLTDFDMRELIFVGSPPFVKAQRDEAEKKTKELFVEWDLAGKVVPANDPFFTEEFRAKALLQQMQDLKHELTVQLPEGQPLAISSFNYHMTHFTAPFSITGNNGRPAASACVGFGLERWVYAITIRHGLDPASWPRSLREPFETWRNDYSS